MKQRITTKNLFLAVIIIVLVWFVYPNLGTPTTVATIGDEMFTLEVAKTELDRARGLSEREGLEPYTGMLFVFDEPNFYSFWMKDMLFPIDIAWLDSEWCIVHIASNVQPESYPTTYAPSLRAQYVIELDAGVFAQQGVQRGTCLDAPSI